MMLKAFKLFFTWFIKRFELMNNIAFFFSFGQNKNDNTYNVQIVCILRLLGCSRTAAQYLYTVL